jgi:hypothetical protein
MGKVKEQQFEDSRRKQINKAAETYLCDQEEGDNCDAYAVLLEESDKGNGDCRAADFVTVWQPLENSVSVDEMIHLIEDSISEPEVPEILQKIDWTDLRGQKTVLLKLIDEIEKQYPPNAIISIPVEAAEALTGILNLIDSLQDFAVDEMGVNSIHVFDFEEEENREASTPEENFARTNAEIIFQTRIEGEGLYVDDEMSKEFIESIVDDRYHSDIIKDMIRRDILNDVTLNPDNFDKDEDGNFTYDASMSEYGFAIEEYCREQFKQRSCKYKVWVEVERIVLDKEGNEESYTDEECPIGIAYRDNLEDAVKLQELIENGFGEL